MNITELAIDQRAVILSYTDKSFGDRLIERGMAPTDEIHIDRISPYLVALRTCDQVFCIRKEDAVNVTVELIVED